MLSWAYNEEKLIGAFLKRAVGLLDQTVRDWELVIVDDGSTDRTPELIAQFAANEPRVRLVRHPRNLNVGWACRTAIRHARKEYLFWETVDWAYDIGNLRIFLELLKYYDVVQGVRPPLARMANKFPLPFRLYSLLSQISDRPGTALVSVINYYVIRTLFAVPFYDYQNVTFYPTRVLHSLHLQGESSFVNPELLIRTYWRGLRFIEVPISFVKRSAGEGKGTKSSAMKRSVNDIVSNWLRWGRGLRPKHQRYGGQIFRVMKPYDLPPEVRSLVEPLIHEFART